MDTAEEWISKLEDQIEELSQWAIEKEKEKLNHMEDRSVHIRITGVPEKKRGK